MSCPLEIQSIQCRSCTLALAEHVFWARSSLHSTFNCTLFHLKTKHVCFRLRINFRKTQDQQSDYTWHLRSTRESPEQYVIGAWICPYHPETSRASLQLAPATQTCWHTLKLQQELSTNLTSNYQYRYQPSWIIINMVYAALTQYGGP